MLRKRIFRALRVLAPGVGCLVAALSPASADRASLTVEQSVIGQTNVLRTPDHEQGDGSYEVRPRLRFERPAGDLQYLLEYAPTYDVYFRTDGIDGFDQYGQGRASFSPWSTGTAFVHTDLAYYRSIRSDTVTGPSGALELIPNVSGRVFRAIADAGYEHRLTPTTTAKGTIDFASYDYSTATNPDSLGFGGELKLVHELERTFAAGVYAAASYREFDELSSQPESYNTVFQGGPVLRFLPTPTLVFEGQAGPAWVSIHRDPFGDRVVPQFRTVASGGGIAAAVFSNCGTFAGFPLLSQCPLAPANFFAGDLATPTTIVNYPGSSDSYDDDVLDGFARFLARHEEEWGSESIEYFRGEEASSGGGATSIRDSVTAAVELDAGDNWSFRVRGNWNQRETRERFDRTEVVAVQSARIADTFQPLAEAQGGLEAQGLIVVARERRKTTQYWADARLRRQITPALSADLELRYLYQDRSGSFSDVNDFEDWKGVITLRYELPALDY
jgi:hypothetical protein